MPVHMRMAALFAFIFGKSTADENEDTAQQELLTNARKGEQVRIASKQKRETLKNSSKSELEKNHNDN